MNYETGIVITIGIISIVAPRAVILALLSLYLLVRWKPMVAFNILMKYVSLSDIFPQRETTEDVSMHHTSDHVRIVFNHPLRSSSHTCILPYKASCEIYTTKVKVEAEAFTGERIDITQPPGSYYPFSAADLRVEKIVASNLDTGQTYEYDLNRVPGWLSELDNSD